VNDYSFRYRFQMSPRTSLFIDEPRWETTLGDGLTTLILESGDCKTPIRSSRILVFTSDGWGSQDAASEAAARYFPALALTLARLRIGAHYGHRALKGGFTAAGLAWFEELSGRRCLNDEDGLTVYESEPPPHVC